jgi:hypothetical protein
MRAATLLRLFGRYRKQNQQAMRWLHLRHMRMAAMANAHDLEGYDDLVERLLSTLSPEARLAGLSPEEVMRHYTPEQRLAGLAREEVLAGLSGQRGWPGCRPRRCYGTSSRSRSRVICVRGPRPTAGCRPR